MISGKIHILRINIDVIMIRVIISYKLCMISFYHSKLSNTPSILIKGGCRKVCKKYVNVKT